MFVDQSQDLAGNDRLRNPAFHFSEWPEISHSSIGVLCSAMQDKFFTISKNHKAYKTENILLENLKTYP